MTVAIVVYSLIGLCIGMFVSYNIPKAKGIDWDNAFTYLVIYAVAGIVWPLTLILILFVAMMLRSEA